MNVRKPPAIILGLGVNGLGIAYSLAMEGIPLYGFYTKKEEIGRFSKYVIPIKAANIKYEPEIFSEQGVYRFHYAVSLLVSIVLWLAANLYIYNRKVGGRKRRHG